MRIITPILKQSVEDPKVYVEGLVFSATYVL